MKGVKKGDVEGGRVKGGKDIYYRRQYILWVITAQKTMYFATMKTYIAGKTGAVLILKP